MLFRWMLRFTKAGAKASIAKPAEAAAHTLDLASAFQQLNVLRQLRR